MLVCRRKDAAPRRAVRVVSALLAALALAACSRAGSSAAVLDPAGFTPPPASPSWAAAPVQRAGLSTLAEPQGTRLALHTRSGDVRFWTGVNLGSTTPGHNPGELAITGEDYRRWFRQMGRLGVRVVREYTIHPPQMYQELAAYDRAHPSAPLYLVQGVTPPGTPHTATPELFNRAATDDFSGELRDASAAVHGALVRPTRPGRASGRWTADVSPWLAGWIVGLELDPRTTLASDRANAGVPDFHGRYFSSVADSSKTSPTERWLAARMDELATAEAARGRSAPIAFVNWPTTDPLRHAYEPLVTEDLVGIDANHVRASPAWPGGTFASMHAYPYYPDFLRHEPAYLAHRLHGVADAYAGYLADLARHFKDMPLLITEVGVPSSIGSAHLGTNGRDQGGHSEQQELAIDAALIHTVHDEGLSGALLFAWTDEWFKRTWNTAPRQEVVYSERRSLWHDPLTNEQFFGLNAEDSRRSGSQVVFESPHGVRQVVLDHDASYVYVTVGFDAPPVSKVRLGFDLLPGGLALPGGGGSGQDVAVVVDPRVHTATAQIRADLDPLLLDGQRPADLPRPGPDGWSLERLSTNRSFLLKGVFLPAEFQSVGDLREGTWDLRSPRQDSRSTWHLDGSTLNLRLPWSMLALADPSSHTAVRPVAGRPTAVPITDIALVVDAGVSGAARGLLRWEGWQRVEHTERLKPGIQPVIDAWAAVSQPAP